ncbi:hypothetical protein [Catenuloplanes indicus]|uniref:Uncharacterized protein n=1 Tax=Catenuloplanes indicus TaxID=137267 RepID=A0AAE3VZQ7_9ACTN|nr:hypothetical protein [Catenuloplanes indicus]MDQ0366786.1 hypothetical protein [Catenuloplanes indicus]
MTTQPDPAAAGQHPAPAGKKPVRELVEPLREIAAFVLLGANAVFLFIAFLNLSVQFGYGASAFTDRAAASFGDFINLVTIGFPLIAVLLAVFVAPAASRAKLIVTVALAEFAVSAFFGLLFGLMVGVVSLAAGSVLNGFTALLARLAWAAVLGLVAYGVWTIFQAHYYTPRPKPAPPVPGMYGQPGPYPGQPYPGQPYPGQPYPGQPQHPGQPQQQGQHVQYGFPPQQQYGAPYGDPQNFGADQTAAYPVQPPPAGSPAVPQYPDPQSAPPAPQQQYYPAAPQSGPPAPQSAPPVQPASDQPAPHQSAPGQPTPGQPMPGQPFPGQPQGAGYPPAVTEQPPRDADNR